jgi:hypothetical protein
MDERVIELSLKTTRVRRREHLDFTRDRAAPSGRTTYMAHGRGYVMVRHPGCTPFIVNEKDWLAWPFFWKAPE